MWIRTSRDLFNLDGQACRVKIETSPQDMSYNALPWNLVVRGDRICETLEYAATRADAEAIISRIASALRRGVGYLDLTRPDDSLPGPEWAELREAAAEIVRNEAHFDRSAAFNEMIDRLGAAVNACNPNLPPF